MKVALVQDNLHWLDPKANKALFKSRVEENPGHDLYVFPEMFSTGFETKSLQVYESETSALDYLQELANRFKAAFCTSVLLKEKGNFYNRCFFVHPNGYERYNKRHLFSFAEEHHHISAGTEPCVFNYGQWRMALFVCYDLRFPVWSRNKAQEPYDIAIYVANWPQARISAWTTLLKARAIENQCYVLGCNRVGTDGLAIPYNGASAIINPYGETMTGGINETAVYSAQLNRQSLTQFRSKFPVLNDADKFEIFE